MGTLSSQAPNPKGPCTQIVYTLALKWSLCRYIGAKVYTIWAHGPLGKSNNSAFYIALRFLVRATTARALAAAGAAAREATFWGCSARFRVYWVTGL